MGTPEPATFASLERLAQTLIDQARQRLALAAIEMSEEEIRFARALGWQLTALFLTCLTITLAVLLPIAIWWDTPDRWVAVAWALGVVAASSGAAWWFYSRFVRRRPLPFSQTIEELKRDSRALDPAVSATTVAAEAAPMTDRL